ncbi:MAG: DMT family transporter [Acidimicrobiia bacterium]|nr:DMT family transporter [Acidimicrobiia bacterium]
MIESLVGPAFGLLTAVFFAAGSILARIGQRNRPDDDGVFMTVLVNVVVLFLATLFVKPPEWNRQGIVALIIGGIIGTVLGRTSLLRTVRLLGPSRASGFVVGTPVVAAIGGWIVLGESITLIEGIGGTITLVGFWLLARARSTGNLTNEKPPVWYYLVGLGAPVFFGTAFVFRKYGLNLYPDSYRGAFIGAASAFPIIVLIDAFRGQLGERIRTNFQTVNWWFVAGGVATAGALLSQFTAFSYLPAWVVGIFAGTQGIFAMMLSKAFLKHDDHLDRTAIISVVLSTIGVVIISWSQGIGG